MLNCGCAHLYSNVSIYRSFRRFRIVFDLFIDDFDADLLGIHPPFCAFLSPRFRVLFNFIFRAIWMFYIKILDLKSLVDFQCNQTA